MNTANLQLEGLLTAVAELSRALVTTGALSQGTLDDIWTTAKAAVTTDSKRWEQLSASQLDAVLFPIRYLALASRREALSRSFFDLATEVGRLKPDRTG